MPPTGLFVRKCAFSAVRKSRPLRNRPTGESLFRDRCLLRHLLSPPFPHSDAALFISASNEIAHKGSGRELELPSPRYPAPPTARNHAIRRSSRRRLAAIAGTSCRSTATHHPDTFSSCHLYCSISGSIVASDTAVDLDHARLPSSMAPLSRPLGQVRHLPAKHPKHV